MKGFIFTLDAVFALIVAAAGISILLYVHSIPVSTYMIPTTEALSVLNNLLYATPSSLYFAPLLYNITSPNASACTWPQFAHFANMSSSSSCMLKNPYVLFTFNTGSTAIQSIIAEKGMVFVGSGSYIYALNATNGKKIYAINANSGIAGTPIAYDNELLFVNSTSILAANIYNGTVLWHAALPISLAPGEPMLMEDGYISITSGTSFYLINPLNGTPVASNSVSSPYSALPPVYANGEFIVAVNSSTQNYLYAYALANHNLLPVWKTPIMAGGITLPVVIGNKIIVGSGTNVYSFTSGGTFTSTSVGSQVKGLACDGSNLYVETATNIYAYNATGANIFSFPTIAQLQYTVPSVSRGNLYTLIDGDIFQAYNISQGRMLWSLNLPTSSMSLFANIALAYGNAYIASGTMLYAFGNYKIGQGTSALEALAGMYLNNEGGEANLLLNSLYPSSDLGLFINSTYAPSLKIADLNGFGSNATIDTSQPLLIKNATIAVWAKWNGGVHLAGSGSRQEIVGADSAPGYEGNPIIALNDSGKNEADTLVCTTSACWVETKSPAGLIQPGRWYFLVSRYNGSDVSLWVNGVLENYSAVSGNLSAQGSGDYVYIGSRSNTGNYFNGSITNVQIYNASLSSSQIQSLYQSGPFGEPVLWSALAGWWPMLGNANDYSGHFYANFETNIKYSTSNIMPPGLQNAYEISKACVPLSINVNGTMHMYNVSVVLWR